MAGMFYSIAEAAEKLGKTEQQVDEMVKNGQLREFRDGSTVLFKVEEIDALCSQVGGTAESQTTPPEAEIAEDELDISLTEDISSLDVGEEPEAEEESVLSEPTEESGEIDEFDILSESEDYFDQDQDVKAEQPADEEPNLSSEAGDADLISSEDEEMKLSEPEEDLLNDDTISDQQASSFDLAMETASEGSLSDERLEDTKSDSSDFLSDDVLGGDETGEEASLEEIEEDVNLDSFGSGSGLLDLNLQADDTSLGGVLEDIYSSEGDDAGGEVGVADLMETGEGQDILGESAEPLTSAAIASMTAGRIEPAPTPITNAIGLMLFLPLLAAIYTAILVVAGFVGVIPNILGSIEGIIWYIAAGLAVTCGIILGAASMTGSSGEKTQRKPKAKKERNPKVKKEKKAKK
ncbi:MAG: hypothetical protein H8D47_03715 [Planctomycetes bacterium]|nr:hypothetical protein [Planctomycetota bacterium]